DHPELHSFPTRRSSDLETKQAHRDSDELSLRCEIWQREWLGLRLLFRLPRRNSQLLQLGIAHRGRRIHHQINGTSGLWEGNYFRSEEHTSELQSLAYLV